MSFRMDKKRLGTKKNRTDVKYVCGRKDMTNCERLKKAENIIENII